jgi:hypothetical protein
MPYKKSKIYIDNIHDAGNMNYKNMYIEYNNKIINCSDIVVSTVNAKNIYDSILKEEYKITLSYPMYIKEHDSLINKGKYSIDKRYYDPFSICEIIFTILKNNAKMFYYKKEWYKKKENPIKQKLEKAGIYHRYYRQKNTKRMAGTFFKSNNTYKTDTDLYELASAHDIANIERKYNNKEVLTWDRYRSKIDIKRYKRILNNIVI